MPAVWRLSAASGFRCRWGSDAGRDDDRDQALCEVCGISGFGRADDELGRALGPALRDQCIADHLCGGGVGVEARSKGKRKSGRSLEVRIQINTSGFVGRDHDRTGGPRKSWRCGGGFVTHGVSHRCASGHMARAVQSFSREPVSVAHRDGMSLIGLLRVSRQFRHIIFVCEGASAVPTAFGAIPF